MKSDLNEDELEWLTQRLCSLGNTAHKNSDPNIVRLVNFYWKKAQELRENTRPLWLEAA